MSPVNEPAATAEIGFAAHHVDQRDGRGVGRIIENEAERIRAEELNPLPKERAVDTPRKGPDPVQEPGDGRC